ncbi:MAG: hypothetical protein K2X39_01005, partial [Silvanigrellaceae bacterium]|nr:hypothetical protein [Silvanigrellaceae bacterium]
RALSSEEILQLYRRGANQVKLQYRICSDASCSTNPSWVGPDGTDDTYFTEEYNTTPQAASSGLNPTSTGGAVMTFSNFGSTPSGTYAQYKATLISYNTAGTQSCNYGSVSYCFPELQEVSLVPQDSYSVISTSMGGVSFTALSSMVETLGTIGCPNPILYNLSTDGGVWYYYSTGSSSWNVAGGTHLTANTATALGSVLSSFPSVGNQLLYLKVFLDASSASSCSISNVEFQGYN